MNNNIALKLNEEGISSTKNLEVIGESIFDVSGQLNKGSSTLSWYTNPFGGHVFAVGTFYWNWFLDAYGKTSLAKENPDVQIITKNALDALIKHYVNLVLPEFCPS
jgi:hypothetical protein